MIGEITSYENSKMFHPTKIKALSNVQCKDRRNFCMPPTSYDVINVYMLSHLNKYSSYIISLWNDLV